MKSGIALEVSQKISKRRPSLETSSSVSQVKKRSTTVVGWRSSTKHSHNLRVRLTCERSWSFDFKDKLVRGVKRYGQQDKPRVNLSSILYNRILSSGKRNSNWERSMILRWRKITEGEGEHNKRACRVEIVCRCISS